MLAYGKELDGVIRMLGIAFSGKISSDNKKNYLKQGYGIKVGMENERRLAVMCNLSEGIWEAARKEGMEQGIKEGRIAVLENALKVGLPEEKIQQILEITVEEMNQLKQELGK